MKLKNFKNWTILSKILSISISTITLLILGVIFYILPFMEKSLLEEKKLATKSVVEVASSIIASLQEDVKNGKITVEHAKSEALKAIGFLKYHGNEYFWVMDFEPTMLMHGVNADLIGKNVGDTKQPDAKIYSLRWSRP
jgi:methyl-accepting chemotaxis protein